LGALLDGHLLDWLPALSIRRDHQVQSVLRFEAILGWLNADATNEAKAV
jgi:hypothetical protein